MNEPDNTSPTPEFRLLVLKTTQPQVLRSFYSHLGFVFQREQHRSGPVHYSAPLGEGIFEIYPLPEDRPTDDTTRLGLAVCHVEDLCRSLANPNDLVIPPRKTEWGVRAVVRDPDGRRVELYEKPLA